jgi:predicted Zn-dependent peptidase
MEGFEARKGHLNPEALERIRKRMIGDYIVAFDSLKATAQNFVAYFFREMNLFHELMVLGAITLEDLDERLREHFHVDYHAVSIIHPAEEENR